MTCDEYRKVVGGGPPSSVTRAVRAAMTRHRDNCPDCRAWLAAILAVGRAAGLPSDPAELAREIAEDRALAARDRQDPEYRAVAYGEK